jgi:hypothetical protein
MELAIQKYLRKFGFDKTVNDFKLKVRDYDNKVLLKYDQLVSPTLMSAPEMQDCRGVVLEKGTWKVMSLAFRKFFNHGESNASRIDWSSAQVLEKLDGTMIQVYWDWNAKTWFAATTGTANGEGEVNNKEKTTFNMLFWDTLKNKYGVTPERFSAGYIYVFELTTPYNIVVKPHAESSTTMVTMRIVETLEEVAFSAVEDTAKRLGIPSVKVFDLNTTNVGGLIKTFETMPWSEEGYVVCDHTFSRVKIKNPAYVAVHHLKGKTAEHNIMTIVKANEIEEFMTTFPERKDELLRLKANYDELVAKLNVTWETLKTKKPKNIDKKEQKRYAMEVFSVCESEDLKGFTGLYFMLAQYKVNSVEEFMVNYDDKILYKLL